MSRKENFLFYKSILSNICNIELIYFNVGKNLRDSLLLMSQFNTATIKETRVLRYTRIIRFNIIRIKNPRTVRDYFVLYNSLFRWIEGRTSNLTKISCARAFYEKNNCRAFHVGRYALKY